MTHGSRNLTLLLAAGSLALAGVGGAQTDRLVPGPPHETRLTIGERPPTTFALPSATDGALHDLEARRGERPILLLFFRGTW